MSLMPALSLGDIHTDKARKIMNVAEKGKTNLKSFLLRYLFLNTKLESGDRYE